MSQNLNVAPTFETSIVTKLNSIDNKRNSGQYEEIPFNGYDIREST